jgi:hypothetical protein
VTEDAGRGFVVSGRVPGGARWFHLDAACTRHPDLIFATWSTFGENVLLQPRGPRTTKALGWVPSPKERAQIQALLGDAVIVADEPPAESGDDHGLEVLGCPRPSCEYEVPIRWDTYVEVCKFVRFLWTLELDRVRMPGPGISRDIESFARFLGLLLQSRGNYAALWGVMSTS